MCASRSRSNSLCAAALNVAAVSKNGLNLANSKRNACGGGGRNAACSDSAGEGLKPGISPACGNHVVSKEVNVTQAMFVADNGPNKRVSLIAAETNACVKPERSSARFQVARHA